MPKVVKSFINNIAPVVTMAVLFLGTPVFALTQQEAQAQINQINQQINDINQSITANKQQQQTVAQEVAALDSQIQVIELQMSVTQAEINLTNNQITDLNAQIDEAAANLVKQKAMLSEYIKTMYINGQSSQLELILTSNNFSDFVDKSEYISTMQQNVSGTISKIQSLTEELKTKKAAVEVSKAKAESLMAAQAAQRNAVATQQSSKNAIIAGLEASNKSLTKQKNDSYAQKAALSAAFNETLTGGLTNYPYGNPVPASIADTVDPWGYYKGECTSYVAWKRLTINKPIPPAIGNGGQWRGSTAGYPQSDIPQYGDVMVFTNLGYYGHVAFVEATRSDGWVYISEYNVVPFSYTERWVNPWNYSFLFIH